MFVSLNTPPRKSAPLFWADYIEVLAILHLDKCFSKGDLRGVAQRSKDFGERFDYETKWKDVADFVEARSAAFGEFYPYALSEDKDTLEFRFNETPEHTAYVALLLASCLRLISNDRMREITGEFEIASYRIFSQLQPQGSEVRATGVGGASSYQGTLYEKMKQIAQDIRCKPNFDQEDMHERDRGDGGVDLIAWHPMEDSRDAMPIAFAQCGCSKDDWVFKQLEAHPAKLHHYLPTRHPWATYYFMPLDFRRSDGNWVNKFDLASVIIVDRLRILKLARLFGVLGNFPPMEYVQHAREFRAEI